MRRILHTRINDTSFYGVLEITFLVRIFYQTNHNTTVDPWYSQKMLQVENRFFFLTIKHRSSTRVYFFNNSATFLSISIK